MLDFVSAPTKEIIIEEAPNIFDYTELDKYGYGVSIYMYIYLLQIEESCVC